MRLLAALLLLIGCWTRVSAQQPALIEITDPVYSDEARVAELEGVAILTAVVGVDGYARDLKSSRLLGLGLDEQAMEAVRQWRFSPALLDSGPRETTVRVPVHFTLGEKVSRWHLMRVDFDGPQGGERARFLSTSYPPGAGISADAFDQASLVRAMGRYGTATISFDIGVDGVPVNFVVEASSDRVWGKEAVAVLPAWRFTPAKRAGAAVASRGSVVLAWGGKRLDRVQLAQWSGGEAREPVNAGLRGEYTDEAVKARVEGIVEVAFVLGADGKPRDLKVVRGLGHGLDEKAMETVSQTMIRLNGLASVGKDIEQKLSVSFRLDEAAVPLVAAPRRK